MDIGSSLQLRQRRSLVTTPQLRQAIGLLQTTNAGLGRAIAAEAARNPYLEVTFPSGPDRGAHPQSSSQAPSPSDIAVADHRPSLVAHVLAQVDLCIGDRRDREIALGFVEALEPSGWLGRSVEAIAAECRCAPHKAEAVLARLQTMEPAGLFARTLRECLALQAADRGELSAQMRLVLDNLAIVAEHGAGHLAALHGADPLAIGDCLAALRRFNPKPGAEFHFDPGVLREPDVIVSRGADGWAVDLNRSTLPTVIVRDVPQGVAQAGAGPRDTALYQAARWLEQAVAQRNRTTLAVACEVVRRQSAFLETGVPALRPLRLADVAGALDIHESTVSRVCTGLLLDTPGGVLPMKAFFAGAIASASDSAGVAVAAVQHRLQRIVAAENPQAPLSDAQIVARLGEEGLTLARRTVAKYRALLDIPAAPARRRVKGAAAGG